MSSRSKKAARVEVRGMELSRRWTYAVLGVILLLAAGLRLYGMGIAPPGLYLDEAADGVNAVQAWETGDFRVFYPEDNGREGLYINLAAVAVHFLGAKAWALRIPAAIFGILTVWGVYALAAELLSPLVGLGAAFFLATSYWHLTFSRIAFRAIGAPFFLVWALYLLLLAFRRVREGRGFAVWAMVAGLVYGLGFHTYTAYRVTPVIVLAVLGMLFVEARKGGYAGRYWASVGLFAAGAAVAAYPLAAYAVSHPDDFGNRMNQVSVFSSARPGYDIMRNTWTTFRMLYWQGDGNWRHNYAGLAEVYWPVAVLMTLGVVMAARKKAMPGVVLLWLVCGAAPAVFSNEGLPHALRSILMLPAIAILAAMGAAWVGSAVQARVSATMLAAGVIAVACGLAGETGYRYFALWARDVRTVEAFDGSMVRVAEQINALPAGRARVVAIEGPREMADVFFLPLVAVRYLTESVTEKQMERAKIRYYTPETAPFAISKEPGAGNFCAQVQSAMPEANVVCLGGR